MSYSQKGRECERQEHVAIDHGMCKPTNKTVLLSQSIIQEGCVLCAMYQNINLSACVHVSNGSVLPCVVISLTVYILQCLCGSLIDLWQYFEVCHAHQATYTLGQEASEMLQ